MTLDEARAIERDPILCSRAQLVLALQEFRRELDRQEAALLEQQRLAALAEGRPS